MKKDIRIVVLPAGWVVVGIWSKKDNECRLDNAYVIRNWGTTAGLGEIAMNGPTSKTVLDRCTIVRYYSTTSILSIDCDSDRWSDYV